MYVCDSHETVVVHTTTPTTPSNEERRVYVCSSSTVGVVSIDLLGESRLAGVIEVMISSETRRFGKYC